MWRYLSACCRMVFVYVVFHFIFITAGLSRELATFKQKQPQIGLKLNWFIASTLSFKVKLKYCFRSIVEKIVYENQLHTIECRLRNACQKCIFLTRNFCQKWPNGICGSLKSSILHCFIVSHSNTVKPSC